MSSPSRARALGALLGSPGLLSILFWGASFIATVRARAGFTPCGIVALRFLIGAAALALLQLARGGSLWPERADLPRCLLLGAILALHILVQVFALDHTSALHSGWLVAVSPIAIALGAALFFGERVPPRAWGGLALASAGAALVVLAHDAAAVEARAADLWVLGTCLTWALYTLLLRAPVARSGVLRVTPLVMAVAGVLALAATPWTGISEPALAAPSWAALAFLGLGSSGIAFAAWARTVERFGPTRAGALLYVQPFVTQILSLVVLHEPCGWTVLLGGPLVLLGVALVSRR